MRILLTGNKGLVGRAVQRELVKGNHEVIGYDLKDSHDVASANRLIDTGRGCHAIVHLAALLGKENESADEILRTNLLGTLHVLESAKANQVDKVIFMSSAGALGVFQGEGIPSYFPLDDAHPRKPMTPYAISKKLAEEACETFSEVNSIPVICFRPPGVWTHETYLAILKKRQVRPEYRAIASYLPGAEFCRRNWRQRVT